MFKQLNNKYKDFVASGYLMDLSDFISLPEVARERIRGLAGSLAKDIKLADEKLFQFRLRSELPITRVDKNEIEFFESNVVPNISKIDNLASDAPEIILDLDLELKKLFEGMDFSNNDGRHKPSDIYKLTLLRTIDELLCHEPEQENGDELVTLYADDLDFEGLKFVRQFISSKYFDPQGWMDRGKQVSLLFSSQDALKYPMRIRGRVAEAYNAYVSGYSFACIATCRSLLEYVLVDRARSNTKWKFDPYDIKTNGEREIKSLFDLCDIFSNISPDLDPKLNFIRLNGNRVLHAPSNAKKEELPHKAKLPSCVLGLLLRLLRNCIARFAPNKSAQSDALSRALASNVKGQLLAVCCLSSC